MRWIIQVLAVLAIVEIRASPASAQCEHWLPGPPIAGINNDVHDALVWNDGSGPALYVGGTIYVAGGERAWSVAKWDGRAWHTVGQLPGTCERLGVYKGQLIAAGSFYPKGNIHRFDGSAWIEIPGAPRDCWAIQEYKGLLVVGGDFTSAGGVNANYIASWDGEKWGAMQGGVIPIGDPEYGPFVYTLAEFGGELIVGGNFKKAGPVEAWSLAAWNGAEWRAIVQEHLLGVSGLMLHKGQLIITGYFTTIGGIEARSIASWDRATWSAFGEGLDGPGDVAELDGQLVVAQGDYGPEGPIVGIKMWTGADWQSATGDLRGQVSAFRVFDGRFIFAGRFATEGVPVGRCVAAWDGAQWRALQDGPFGPDGPIGVLGEYHGNLVAGGTYWSVDGKRVNAIATFDGTSWHSLGLGLQGTPYGLTLATALGVHNDRLVVSGSFGKAGDVDVFLMAQWDGTDWSKFGFVPTDPARCMTPWNDWLIIGGEFIGQNPWGEYNYDWAGYIVKAPGQNKCEPLGGGVYGNVYAVTTYRGDVVAGGQFTNAGKNKVKRIARFDGTEWQPLGSGLDSSIVKALAVVGDDLYAAGYIWHPGGDDYAIASFDGSEWHELGPGIDGYVNALAVHNGQLFAGGKFDLAGGKPAKNIARWDGAAWHALDDGLDDEVLALKSYNGRLYAGGNFAGSGSGSVSSPFLAVWGCSPCPADCDGSGSLDIDDFICFQTLFGFGDLGADCDASGELDIDDFICFQSSFAQGCP